MDPQADVLGPIFNTKSHIAHLRKDMNSWTPAA